MPKAHARPLHVPLGERERTAAQEVGCRYHVEFSENAEGERADVLVECTACLPRLRVGSSSMDKTTVSRSTSLFVPGSILGGASILIFFVWGRFLVTTVPTEPLGAEVKSFALKRICEPALVVYKMFAKVEICRMQDHLDS